MSLMDKINLKLYTKVWDSLGGSKYIFPIMLSNFWHDEGFWFDNVIFFEE